MRVRDRDGGRETDKERDNKYASAREKDGEKGIEKDNEILFFESFSSLFLSCSLNLSLFLCFTFAL